MRRKITGDSGTKYIVGRFLDGGGFGVVHLATSEGGDDSLVVKILGDDAKLAESVQREWRASMSIDHPNVVTGLDFGAFKDTNGKEKLFVVMPFWSGGNLRTWINGAAKSTGHNVDTILTMFDEIAAGVEAINAAAIHRDLKPENILINDQGHFGVADLGMARFVDDATKSMTFKGGGSFPYMASETWEDKTPTVGVDVYAIGTVLFEMLTGVTPLTADDVFAWKKAHIFSAPISLGSVLPDAPVKLASIISRTLDKDPNRRHASVAELRSDLASLANGAYQENGDAVRFAALASKANALTHAKSVEESQKRNEMAKAQEERDKVKARRSSVISAFDAAVEKINGNLSGQRIERRELAPGDVEYRFQNRVLEIEFFSEGSFPHPDGEANSHDELKEKNVVAGGVISAKLTTGEMFGWNLVLTRTDEDILGIWTVCETRASALVGMSFRDVPDGRSAPIDAREFTRWYANHLDKVMDVVNIKERKFDDSFVEAALDEFLA